MKKVIFTLLVLFSALTYASLARPTIIGAWKFTGFIYHNEFRPPLNPNLNIEFRFLNDGTKTLLWTRNDERGHCLRTANYSINGNFLSQEITWVDPNNRIDCSKDSDMQAGAKSQVAFDIKDNQLRLNLGLAGEDFYYVFARE